MDPTLLFTASVVLVPLVYCADAAAAVAYLTQPTLLASLAVTAAVVAYARAGPRAALTKVESMLACWFLCNGVYFNFFLDVVAGQMQMMGEMSKQYNKVEPRYVLGALSDAGAPVFMTSLLEALFHAPFGVFAYIAIVRGWPQRYTAALIVSILHPVGVAYFYVPEVLNGFRHLGGWPATMAEALSFDRLLFFWFGFWFCGVLWIIVPVVISRYAWIKIGRAVAVADGGKRE